MLRRKSSSQHQAPIVRNSLQAVGKSTLSCLSILAKFAALGIRRLETLQVYTL